MLESSNIGHEETCPLFSTVCLDCLANTYITLSLVDSVPPFLLYLFIILSG